MDTLASNPLGRFLKQYRDEHDLSLRELAERAGISHGSISNIERGFDSRTKKPLRPSAKHLTLLARAMRVEPAFLVALASGQAPSEAAIDPRAELLQVLESQARDLDRLKRQIQVPEMREIPHYGPVACGNTGLLPETPVTVKQWPAFLVDAADFSVQVKGNSLDRRGLMEGDWVFLKRAAGDRRPREGAIVLVSVREGEDYFATLKVLSKRHGRFWLDPDSSNPDHHAVPVENGTRVPGQVVWHCSDPKRFL